MNQALPAQNILFTILVQEWHLEVPNGFELTFESFDIEAHSSCTYDWVEVSIGSYSEKFCGSSIPGPFTSTGPTMTVRMHSDGNRITGKGFQAVWLDTSPDFLWVGDNSVVDGSNWAPGFPVSG